MKSTEPYIRLHLEHGFEHLPKLSRINLRIKFLVLLLMLLLLPLLELLLLLLLLLPLLLLPVGLLMILGLRLQKLVCL